MSKTIQEQIEVMQHFANGGKIETKAFHNSDWIGVDFPKWDWSIQDYRIKEQRKTITIEKWLCEYKVFEELEGSKRFFIIEKVFPFEVDGKKIKLLDTYEVQL